MFDWILERICTNDGVGLARTHQPDGERGGEERIYGIYTGLPNRDTGSFGLFFGLWRAAFFPNGIFIGSKRAVSKRDRSRETGPDVRRPGNRRVAPWRRGREKDVVDARRVSKSLYRMKGGGGGADGKNRKTIRRRRPIPAPYSPLQFIAVPGHFRTGNLRALARALEIRFCSPCYMQKFCAPR